MSDQTLLELYTRFQGQRRALGQICPQAFYYDFINQGHYNGSAMLATLAAQGHMGEIANSINRLSYDVHSIMAWQNTLTSASEEEHLQALFEFVFPLVSYSLSSPYSIKQKFITSIYEVSYHTNQFREVQFQDKFNHKPSYKDAEKMAKKFSSWPILSTALGVLCNESFSQASSDYRNRFHHGFPPTIGTGHRTVVRPTAPGSYDIVFASPLAITDIASLLIEQCKIAIEVYEKYIELIREQETLWII